MEFLSGKKIAIDAFNTIFQFLSIIRDRQTGQPLMDSKGRVTSHLSGLLYRTANFLQAGIKPIYVFDGDGNILMNLGSLVTIGSIKPNNLVHIIYDNGMHESTGGQPTNSNNVKIDSLAKISNYRVFRVNSKEQLKSILKQIKSISGPIMILIQIEKKGYVSKRIDVLPPLIKSRFMKAIRK